MKTILIVEDDRNLCEGIALAVKEQGLELLSAHTLKAARSCLQSNTVDLLILDINLPDGSGLDLLKEYKENADFPILLLTANDMESDVVLGLECGADDYITKPFSLAILRARVNTQLRKSGGGLLFQQGALHFDFDAMLFSVNGQNIELSKTEQKLLKILTMNKGSTITREQLLAHIWANEGLYIDENALSVTVKRLRVKLGKESRIKTVYGIGYRWEHANNT